MPGIEPGNVMVRGVTPSTTGEPNTCSRTCVPTSLSLPTRDTTMAAAARSVQTDHGAITIEMKTSFFRPAEGAALLRGEGKLLHRTRTLAFVEATIFDEAGHSCAHATGTSKYAPLPPKP